MRNRLDGLLQVTTDGVLIADAAGRLLYANAPAAALHGFPSGAALAAAAPQELDARVEVVDEWGQPASPARLPQLALRAPEAPELPLRFRDRRSREERWAVVRTSALRDGAGRVLALVAVYRDATEQRRSEESLRLLSRAGAMLCGPLDLPGVLDALSRAALPDLGDAAVVELLPQDAALGWPARALLSSNAQIVELPGAAGPVPERAEMVQIASVRAGDRLAPLASAGCTVALIAPLAFHGGGLGTLILGARPDRREPGTADLLLAEDVANRAAAALEGARRLHEAQLGRAHDARRLVALELAHRVSIAVQSAGRPLSGLQACAEAVRRELGARLARVWTCGEQGQLLELQAASNDPVWPELPPLEAFEVRKVAASAEARMVADVLVDPLLASCGPGAFAALPLLGTSSVGGVLALFFPSALPADLGELLGPACEALGIGLQRARELEVAQASHADAAEEARRKEEFLAVLAHELRNPLAPIVTALGLMRTRDSDGKSVARERALVERQVGQLTRLVDDLLDVSRISRGKLELRREPVDLSSVIARAVEASQPLLNRFRHSLSVALPEDPLFLVADPARIAQVVSNLLNNAAKYTAPGGRIRLLVERDGDEAVVRVRDTGIGIPPELLPRIFEPFVQGHDVPEHGRGGLGIGLALVRALAELHNGSVSVVSGGPGSGSEFTVRLPSLPQAELHLPLEPPPHEAVLQSGQGRRVLVVDDNRDAADMLAEALRQWGCDVRVATDGAAALEAAAERRPDVVLLDIGMPGMDGHEVARRLRRDRSLRDVRLIAVTGYGRELDLRQSREAGFDVHFTKPVELEVLMKAIADVPVSPPSRPPPELAQQPAGDAVSRSTARRPGR